MAKTIHRTSPRYAGKPYLVRWYRTPANPSQGQKSFATLAEAEAYLPEAELIEAGGTAKTFREYATRWNKQAEQSKSSKTVYNYEVLFRLHIFPVFGDLPLASITRQMCKDFLLDPELSKPMAWRMRKALGAVFSEAVRDRLIPESPTDHIFVKYDSKRAELVPITYAQLESVGDILEPQWRLANWLMYGCGLRIGEALAVRADSVRENGSILRVEEQVRNWRDRAGNVLGPLKARKPGDYRDIPLAGWLREMVERHVAEFGIEPDGYLFPEFTSGRIGRTTYSKRFEKRSREIGVPRLHPHILRHYFASVNLANGVAMEDVSRWLGHMNIQLTYDTYSHLMPTSAVKAREASDRAMEQFRGEK